MNSFRLFLFCPASTFASSSSHSSSCDATNILYTRIHIRAHIHARMYTRIAHTNVRTTRPVFLRALSRPLFFLFCPASTFLREHSLLPFCVSPPTPLSVPFMTDLTNLENHVSRNVYQNPETSTLDTIVAWSVHGSEIVKRECTLTHRGIAWIDADGPKRNRLARLNDSICRYVYYVHCSDYVYYVTELLKKKFDVKIFLNVFSLIEFNF